MGLLHAEIARFREELKAAKAENYRLRGIEEAHKQYLLMIGRVIGEDREKGEGGLPRNPDWLEVKKIGAERDRYRVALEEIAEDSGWEHGFVIARQALAAPEAEDEER